MSSKAFRISAQYIAEQKKHIKLAIFGPGKNSPYFDKRQLAAEAIQREHPKTFIDFRMLDDLIPPCENYQSFSKTLLPATRSHIKWADIILLLVTHSKLKAFTETLIIVEMSALTGSDIVFQKCGVIFGDNIEVDDSWGFYLRDRLRSPKRFVLYTKDQIDSCYVAKELAVNVFDKIVLMRWGKK